MAHLLEEGENAIRECQRRQRQLVYLYSHEAIDNQYIDEQARAVKARQLEIEQDLDELLKQRDSKVDAQLLASHLREFCSYVEDWLDEATFEQKRQVLRVLQVEVEVDRDYLTIKGLLGASLNLTDIITTERTWA